MTAEPIPPENGTDGRRTAASAPEAESAPSGATGDVDRAKGRSSLLLGTVLAALLLFAGLQLAGVLLRDRIEGRTPPLAEAPPAEEQAAVPSEQPGAETSRFGPDVREVVVASPSPASPAREPDPGVPAGEPGGAGPSSSSVDPGGTPGPGSAQTPGAPAESPESLEPAAPPEPAPPPTPVALAPKGTHALQMGVFRSQRYRHELEAELTDLEIPHFRTEGYKPAAGYKLALAAGDPSSRGRAREAMESLGYAFTETDLGLEAHFHFEREAQRALDLLSKQGVKGGYGRVEGQLPVWTVYAGPFSRAEARRAQERLAEAGFKSFLRRRP